MMRASRFRCLLFFVILTVSPMALAQPPKGFLEGPYLALEGGVVQADFDTDQQSGQRVGRDFEPAMGLLFGWNMTDPLSLELEGQYSTNLNAGRREHILGANIAARYTLLLDRLIDMTGVSILPFATAGGAFRVAILPSNQNAGSQTVTSLAMGPAISAGTMFLWKQYFFFGITLQGNLLFYDDVRQDLDLVVPPLVDQLIYRGGFQPSFASMIVAGVHY